MSVLHLNDVFKDDLSGSETAPTESGRARRSSTAARRAGPDGVFPFATVGDLDAADVGCGPAAVLADLAGGVGAVQAIGLCRDDLEAALGALSRLRAAVDSCEARIAAEIDRLNDFGKDAAGVLRQQSGCSFANAKRAAERARSLTEMPNVADALSEGRITAEHADALIGGAAIAGAASVDSSEHLLDTAAMSPVERTRRAVGDWVRKQRAGINGEELHRRQRALRSLSMTQTAEGMLKATALLDPATAAAFRALIDDLAQRFSYADRSDVRPDAPEPRSYSQCRLDALVALVNLHAHCASRRFIDEDADRIWPEVAAFYADEPRSYRPALAPEHLAHIPADSLAPVAQNSHSASNNRLKRRNQIIVVADAAAICGDEWAPCEIAGTGPIPRRELERLACGADIFGVVFDGDGQALWHGRRVRTVTDAQWRALVARDRHCVLCAMAPSWCEVHHIIPRQAPHRGPTDIDNLALLCRRCHHELHDSGAVLGCGPRNTYELTYDLNRE